MKDPRKIAVGTRITTARHDTLPGESLAQVCNRFGWGYSAFRHYETGARGQSIPVLLDIAKAYNVHFEWLATGKGAMRPVK